MHIPVGICHCDRRGEEQVPPPPCETCTPLRAGAGGRDGAGGCTACRHLWQPLACPPAPRVEESDGKLLASERKLQEERQRAVVLEQHVEKMRLEPGRAAGSQRATSRSKAGLPGANTRHNPNGSERKDPSSSQLSSMPVESQMEELTTRLAIQAEENETLRAALGSALRGKEKDFRMYHETLAQVKSIFLQALRQQKADKH
ncbi:hypothetical protein HJG60_011581 [Phyllostomus discolor]|uniref:Coiled-coil domain-containing protein 13 n=1 Tax=Phyllostomus discolor TaxID=89673 RepID=A0A834DXG8_9CHIR|nr:hypothetical protein HJG60_011581 [Phyllostomus discolor]